MLIKEYRIPLPLTVEEYRIAQLYMIAKKSREESHGTGSGVEIIVNEPYEDGPGGKGQYTKKIYHVGSHLPGWIKSLLPKSALTVEEEAWNAYPFTKTRYTCPFVEKFSLDIETYYFPDKGHQENVFKLSGSELRNRLVDIIDIVKDQLYGGDYLQSEDPKLFISEKTNRGPLDEDWLETYWNEGSHFYISLLFMAWLKYRHSGSWETLRIPVKLANVQVKGKSQPTKRNMSLMCAYKLCRVEFRYWGMQTKLEKFIHDVALRKTMLRAHRQAWAWQDEWHGLTMDDIREIERQTQLALAKKMGNESSDADDEEDQSISEASKISNQNEQRKQLAAPFAKEAPPSVEVSSADEEEETTKISNSQRSGSLQNNQPVHVPKGALYSPVGSTHSFDLQVANWRMEKLEVDSKSGSEEEFFDCLDAGESNSLAKWSSLELLAEEDDSPSPNINNQDDSIFSHAFLQRVASERGSKRQHCASSSVDRERESPTGSPVPPPCAISVLVLVVHAGSVLDANADITSKKSDVMTFRTSFDSVMRQHYPVMTSHVALRFVPCPAICTDALGILSSLSPYSFDSSPSAADLPNIADVPIGAIPLLAVSSPDFQDSVNRTVASANCVYQEFLKSEDGRGFAGQVVIIGDSMGSILAHDALCWSNSRHSTATSGAEEERLFDSEVDAKKLLLAPSPRRRSSSSSDSRSIKLDFEVSDFFMFGTPMSIILASRRLHDPKQELRRPNCMQVYNLFHPTDPIASRLEPLLSARFSMLPPVNIPRYAKYPLGNGHPYHLLDVIQSYPEYFNDHQQVQRRLSDVSMQSTISGITESVPLNTINALQQKWWGTKRLDYALYCPEGLSNFPAHALPHLFHASYWESSDVIAFILRQIGRFECHNFSGGEDKEDGSSFRPGQAREKWIRKRTSVKLKNVTANHRANDVIVLEGSEQKLSARFMYGPLDMITLAGEKVDIHIMKDPPAGEWTLLSTEVTEKNGRVVYSIEKEKAFEYGIYPVKMVVRGDHTSVDFYMAVIPPRTECVAFSIDGSFTASVSVTGRDPKVRAGAVDVCRHWQELGYLLIYITGRPDMQQQKVVSWLSQHNFPHGLVSFADGLSTDPLGHKTAFLKNLIENHAVVIHSAYGSSKDITVYTNIGLKSHQIYIVGKVSKKLQPNATVLNDGYAAHLSNLMAVGGSRPAQGNARMVIPRGCFNLPGQAPNPRRRRLHEQDA